MQSTESSKREFWTKKIADWKTSSMEIREYCRSQGISHNTFYFWRRKLQSETSAATRAARRMPKLHPSSFAKVEINESEVNRMRPSENRFYDAKWAGEFAAAMIRGLR